MKDNSNFTIIGAGIVGLATGLKLYEKYPSAKIIFIEKEKDIALHQTGNNSGVIHSGIYYKPGSLKALNCRKGYDLLLDFCDKNNIKYDLCGKVIVATNEREEAYLDILLERGMANGLKGIRKINADELREIEPHVNGIAGILVPETGIIDYKAVAAKYKELIEGYGGKFFFNETVTSIKQNDKAVVITTGGEYESDYVISCAGLHSDRVAKTTHPQLPLRIIPFRGEYYKLKEEKRFLVKNLIYPVPDPAFPFLGVHFTRMIDGEVEAGPNAVLAFKREGYSKFDFSLKDTAETFAWKGFRKVAAKYWRTGMGEFYRSFSKAAFVKALQKLIPEITADDLEPGGAGIRAQACDLEGGLLDDFYILKDGNVTHVCNAPSPAATSSLAIGEYIAGRIIEE